MSVSLVGTWKITVIESTNVPGPFSFQSRICIIHRYDVETKTLSITELTRPRDKSESTLLKRNLKATFSKTSVTIELGETWGNKIVTIELVNVDKDNGLQYQSATSLGEGMPIASMFRISTDGSELSPLASEVEIKIAPPPPLPPARTSKP
ncbi:MAG: hypothetical protein EOO89_22620 [Pedobacter sp.]|nr:MAG: hypothetical protein EOO89_22620 [Pedobacter sp.]